MAEIRSNAASVEFRNVTKIYGRGPAPAVNDISLFIEAGKLVTLLGPSGCGKTTNLRMIAGLELATSGQILIGGNDVTRLPATERDVSMVFQSYALFPHMTVRENVEYGLKFSGFNKRDVTDKARAGLDLVGLGGYGDRLPSQLSGGQQQRVAVARALVTAPQTPPPLAAPRREAPQSAALQLQSGCGPGSRRWPPRSPTAGTWCSPPTCSTAPGAPR